MVLISLPCEALFAPWPVSAHAGVRPLVSAHVGSIRLVGTLHLELVISDGSAQLYLYDQQNRPVTADTMIAKAPVWTNDGKVEVNFVADKWNVMRAIGAFDAKEVKRVIVTLGENNEPSMKASFSFR